MEMIWQDHRSGQVKRRFFFYLPDSHTQKLDTLFGFEDMLTKMSRNRQKERASRNVSSAIFRHEPS